MKSKQKLKSQSEYSFSDLADIVAILRSPAGCPWDRKQKPANYKDYLLEEVYELIDALNKRDTSAIEEELGDVLLLLVMLSQMYKEQDKFDINKVISGICRKLVRRHPHVFGPKSILKAEEVIKVWTEAKAEEKKRKDSSQRLPKTSPALLKSFLLFKEWKHLGRQEELAKIMKKLKQLPSRLGRRSLARQVMLLSYLAFKRKVNLEEALREEVDSLAHRLSYAAKSPRRRKA